MCIPDGRGHLKKYIPSIEYNKVCVCVGQRWAS